MFEIIVQRLKTAPYGIFYNTSLRRTNTNAAENFNLSPLKSNGVYDKSLDTHY